MGGEFILSLCLVLALDAATTQGEIISAVVGGNATLPCNAERFQPLEVVEWSRPGTNTELVLIFRTQNPDIAIPKKSYEGRVELKDIEEGDMSLFLKDLTTEDGGTYECYVLRERSRRKRAGLLPISTVHLHVAPPPPPGRGHLGVFVGVPLVLLVTSVFVWKMKKSLL